MADYETIPPTPDSLTRRLAAYLPSLLTRELLVHGLPPLGQPRSITAATMFADISGFTAMSEELATDGSRGAEELNRVLLRTFTVMIDEIHVQGGVVSHFYGDAMSVYFPEEAGAEKTAVIRALACAQQLQQQMQRDFRRLHVNRPPGKDAHFELTIKIGVGYGRCKEMVVGDKDSGLEFVLTGEAVEQATQAEHVARSNTIVASANALTQAGLVVDDSDAGLFRTVTELVAPLLPRPLLDWRQIDPDRLTGWSEIAAPFVPNSLLEHLQAPTLGPGDIAEHRPATSLFVQFEFSDDGDVSSDIATAEMGRYLQDYYLWACRLTARFGRANARVNRVLTGDKGNQLHIIFGAPVAPDSPDQALRLALAMQREQPTFVHSQCIGLVAGKVFAGPVGSASRREYTIVGDVVNLSARLMQQAAPGEILTDMATARRVEGVIAFEELPPVSLKGKQALVPIYRAISDEATTIRLQAYVGRQERPLVGRVNEVDLLLGGMETALHGVGGVAAIIGPTGSGKTRLLAEGVRHWLAADGQGLVGISHQHTRETPFGPWRTIWRDFFDLRLESDAAEQKQKVLAKMRELLPDIGDDVYLWGEGLGLSWSLPSALANLPPETRQQRFFRLVRRTLQVAAVNQPLLIILENIHWADQASLALVDDLTEHLADSNLFIAFTFRPLAQLPLATLERSVCLPIVLSDLAPKYGRELLTQLVGVSHLPPAVEQHLGLRDREGRDSPVNPLFLEEALRVMREAGVLRVNGRVVVDELLLARMQVPDTIHGLLLARLDRLAPTSRNLLQIASVIGRQFSLEPLANLSPGVQRQLVLDVLGDLSSEEITRLVAADPEWIYLFQHALTHEVAYESLPYARRHTLHAAMADWLVAEYSDNLKPLHPTLAYHYSRAGIHEEGLRYALAAGEDARAIFANREAVELYGLAETHLLVLGEEEAWETAVDLRLGRAECLLNLGDFQTAVADLNHALSLLASRQDKERLAQCYNLKAEIFYRMADYEGTKSLTAVVIDQWAEQITTDELARACLWQGMALASTQDYDEALAVFGRAEAICEQTGNEKRLARVLEGIGFVNYLQRNLEAALNAMVRSVDLSRAYSIPANISSSLNNIALVQHRLGKAGEALESVEEAMKILDDESHNFMPQYIGNRAEFLAYVGRYQEARLDFDEAARRYLAVQDEIGLIEIYLVRGMDLHCPLREWNNAKFYFDRAMGLLADKEDGTVEERLRLFLGYAMVNIHQNALEDALQHLRKVEEINSNHDFQWWLPQLCYQRALIQIVQEDHLEAGAMLQQALYATENEGNPDIRPLAWLKLAQLATSHGTKLGYLTRCLQALQHRARHADRVACLEKIGTILAQEQWGSHQNEAEILKAHLSSLKEKERPDF